MDLMCDAKIRPFPNPVELSCEVEAGQHDLHRSVLRDYAYPGSATVVNWREDDRRTFRGEWRHCQEPGCPLPGGHRGDHSE